MNENVTNLSRGIPVALSIAGSDNSGGAGIQADLKSFTTLGVFGTTALTCVVAEHPGRVHSIEAVSPESVAAQIRLVFEAYPVAALKTGMLYSAEIIHAVADMWDDIQLNAPLVVDPVMVASSGAVLLKDEALAALKRRVLPKASLVTPNRDEAALLWGRPIQSLETLRVAAADLSSEHGVPFLVKGGHLQTAQAVDVLAWNGVLREFVEPMIPGVNPHGTGCTFSAAITAGLAQGKSLPEAVAMGKRFITRAIRDRFRIGEYDLLNQLPEH